MVVDRLELSRRVMDRAEELFDLETSEIVDSIQVSLFLPSVSVVV